MYKCAPRACERACERAKTNRPRVLLLLVLCSRISAHTQARITIGQQMDQHPPERLSAADAAEHRAWSQKLKRVKLERATAPLASLQTCVGPTTRPGVKPTHSPGVEQLLLDKQIARKIWDKSSRARSSVKGHSARTGSKWPGARPYTTKSQQHDTVS